MDRCHWGWCYQLPGGDSGGFIGIQVLWVVLRSVHDDNCFCSSLCTCYCYCTGCFVWPLFNSFKISMKWAAFQLQTSYHFCGRPDLCLWFLDLLGRQVVLESIRWWNQTLPEIWQICNLRQTVPRFVFALEVLKIAKVLSKKDDWNFFKVIHNPFRFGLLRAGQKCAGSLRKAHAAKQGTRVPMYCRKYGSSISWPTCIIKFNRLKFDGWSETCKKITLSFFPFFLPPLGTWQFWICFPFSGRCFNLHLADRQSSERCRCEAQNHRGRDIWVAHKPWPNPTYQRCFWLKNPTKNHATKRTMGIYQNPFRNSHAILKPRLESIKTWTIK